MSRYRLAVNNEFIPPERWMDSVLDLMVAIALSGAVRGAGRSPGGGVIYSETPGLDGQRRSISIMQAPEPVRTSELESA